MKKNPLTFIDQQTVKIDFKNHLDDEDNKRILFSARFGTGKSTFLKDFFDASQEYIALKLYPVNYSISHNKDVFELIKYDLIYELLSKCEDSVQLQKDDYSLSLMAQMFILHGFKIDPLLKSILKASSPESETYNNIIEQLNGIVKQYSSYKDEINKDELALLNNYISQLKKFKGTAHEHDEISELICSMIERVKVRYIEQGTSVKSVLIIDDIDRLDPEHIFRLFNVFSAHYDSITDENKFSFDKVIFVCDYDNIRLMYEHRYGKGVDFSGYIDKFYSTAIFKYDNRKYIKGILLDIIGKKQRNLPESWMSKYFPAPINDFYLSFEFLLSALLEINALTFRNLDQFVCYDLPTNSIIAGTRNYKYQANGFPFLNLIHLMKKLITTSSLESYLVLLSNKFELDSEFANSLVSQSELCIEYLKEISLEFIVDSKEFFTTQDIPGNLKETRTEFNGKIICYTLGNNRNLGRRFANLRPPNNLDAAIQMPIEKNVFNYLLAALRKSENLMIEQ